MVEMQIEDKNYMNLGASLLLEGQYEEAEKVYRQGIELQPDDPWVHCNLGRSLLYQGKVEEAIPHLQNTIEIEPNLAEAYYNLGNAFTRQNRFEEAVNAYRKAIELEPDQFLYHHQLGDSFLLQGKYKEAVSPYQQAIELNSQYPWSFHNLGKALSELERWSEAIAIYDQFLQLQPDSKEVEALRTFAIQQCQGYRKTDSEPSFQPSEEPDPWLNHHEQADRLRANNQLDEAIAAYRHAIDVNPSYTLSYQNLGDALQEKGLLDRALLMYQEAVEFVESEDSRNYLNGKIKQLEHQFQRMDRLLSQLSPSQLTSKEITINAEFPLTPSQGFSSQDYDRYGTPFRWTIAGKPFGFDLFCDRTYPREILLQLVNQSIENLTVYCVVDDRVIPLERGPSEDKNYGIFTGTLPESQTSENTRIDLIAVSENERLNSTNLLTLKTEKDKIVSVPFLRLILKELSPIFS
ncbi:tetratricopeptide repeat protein [Capilliphycus salinus ALCB114379]|uniref:tetratricopeptide repeat protein n=1 Tax=Capilliphycus salinus TaxID=2768948 RepID=UPI0039A5E2F1